MKDDAYKNLTILCVEDEAGVRKRIVNTLNFYFGRVEEAEDGLVGYDKYTEHMPDIILCDVEMPVMNGIELVKKIREDDKHTPIVILTAYSSEEYLMKLINLKIQHFILKPVNIEKLMEGIEAGLEGKYSSNIRFSNDIFLDYGNNALHVKDETISLSRRETKFLTLLGTYKGRILKYSTIEYEVWKDKEMSQGALKSFVRDLRKKIGIELFENVPQAGYRLLIV